LRELAEFHAEHADPFRFAKTFTEMQIPKTLDGELPSKAFGEKGEPILIGERYLVPDADGQQVAGELVSAVVMESEMSVLGIVRLDDGAHVTVNMPITEHELDLYKESPDTFFGVYEPTTRVVKHPVELYELFLSVYSQTSRDRLLEFLAAHPNIEALREQSQLELAKIYAEGLANNVVSKGKNP